MKRPFTIIVLTLLATFAYAQDSRDEIKALEDFLLNHGFQPTSQYQRGGAAYWGYYSYSYEYIVQPPYPDEGMTEKEVQQLYDRFDSCYAMKRKAFEAVWDSVRLMVNDIVQDADGSYIKEKHQSGNDTIDYRIYFIRTDPESMAYHSPMDSIYPPQRNESVNLDYIQGLFDMVTTRRYEIHASYYFIISEEHTLPAQTDDFDVERFKCYLTEVLAPMLRQKGVRQYPVYWQYDANYPIQQNEDDKNIFLLCTYPPSDDEPSHEGLVTGMHYFIPNVLVDSTDSVLGYIEAEIGKYLDQYREQKISQKQRFKYKKAVEGRLFRAFDPTQKLNEFIRGIYQSGSESMSYSLYSFTDEEGIHLLSLTYEYQNFFIPRGFQKMKRWVNGKATYRR